MKYRIIKNGQRILGTNYCNLYTFYYFSLHLVVALNAFQKR